MVHTPDSSAATPIPSRGELLGLSATHVECVAESCAIGQIALHPRTARALMRLRSDAMSAGFDLRAVSGYRSFERQLLIWNGKARGERELLDEHECPLDAHALAPDALLDAILRWSAVPGCSRHHWGSDLDVVDAAAGDPRLLRRECEGDGACAAMHRWLDDRIAAGEAHGFFRPYVGHGCSVSAEPWHLSFAPLAARCQAAFDPAALRHALEANPIELRTQLIARLAEILDRYVILPAHLYPGQWRELIGTT